jgi:HSP20 family molecular chaperone IbpA
LAAERRWYIDCFNASQKEKFTMKKNSYLDLVTAVDVLNTLNGGMSEPQLSMQEDDETREIKMKIPGVNKDAVHVEIHNNTLTVYHFTLVQSQDKLIDMPRIVYSKTIPYFIDINKISARSEMDDLIVSMPFNKMAKGYHRNLRIRED